MQKIRGGNELEARVSSACGKPGQASRREIDIAEARKPREFGFYFDFHEDSRTFLEGRSRS